MTQWELLPQPPEIENKPLTWPYWPIKLRTSSSHEEGVQRDWAIATKAFKGDADGNVVALIAVRVQWQIDPVSGQSRMVEVPGTEFEVPADLVLLAMGFVSPVRSYLTASESRGDARGNARASADGVGCYQTSVDKVFAAGDMRAGPVIDCVGDQGRSAVRARSRRIPDGK